MSGAGSSHRSRYAWAFLTRHFTRRLDSQGAPRGDDGRPPFEATVIFVDPRTRNSLRGLSVGRSTEMVPTVEYDLSTQVAAPDSDDISLSSTSEADNQGGEDRSRPRTPPAATTQRQQTIDILSGRARRVGSELADLLPFWGNDDEPAMGDDPTFQQLLCLAGVFCGPLMYLIGGILFCVIPREHRQTRRWALFNLVLAICSFVYLASTGSIEEMQRPVAGIHMLEEDDHLPIPDKVYAQYGGLQQYNLNFTGNRILMDFSRDNWRSDWVCDSTAYNRINLGAETDSDNSSSSKIWVFGPTATDQSAVLSTNKSFKASQYIYMRSSLACDRPLQSPVYNSPVRFLDCTELPEKGECKGITEPSIPPDEIIHAELKCSSSAQNAKEYSVPLWSREVDVSISPSGTIRPYMEDVVVNFGANEYWCRVQYMLKSAPAHVYLSAQLIFT